MDNEDNAILGEDDEVPEYDVAEIGDDLPEDDTHEVSDDTRDLSDEEHFDVDSEKLSDLDGKEQAGIPNIPILGMIFETDQEAYDYYNSYARFVGFSVRKKRSNTFKNTNVIRNKEFC